MNFFLQIIEAIFNALVSGLAWIIEWIDSLVNVAA